MDLVAFAGAWRGFDILRVCSIKGFMNAYCKFTIVANAGDDTTSFLRTDTSDMQRFCILYLMV
jgi:hypothetical protein